MVRVEPKKFAFVSIANALKVVLTQVNELRVAKLCDLGIARPYDGEQTIGSEVGALDYQPPVRRHDL